MSNRKITALAVDSAFILLVLCSGFITDFMMKQLPKCIFKSFGVLCPACGGTRCVMAMASFELKTAFVLNPFIFILLIYIGAALILYNLSVFTKINFAEKCVKLMTNYKTIIVIAVLFALFGILRNMF